MSDTNDGGTAFPSSPDAEFTPGMSLRDWFAGLAMQGMMADGALNDRSYGDMNEIASEAFQMADTMLEIGHHD